MDVLNLLSSIWSIIKTYNIAILLSLLSFIFTKFHLPRILKLRDVISEISFALTYFANVFPLESHLTATNKADIEAAQKELRKLGSQLRAARDVVPNYQLMALARFVPTWENTEKAVVGLIGWSNYVFEPAPEGGKGRHEFRKQIAEALGIKSY